MKIYNVRIYTRISQESKNKKYDEDSVSIENQISMLSKFIDMMPGWIKTRTYVDESVSGTTFRRRGFMDMMEDVRSGVINLVLVKDLSRFGRNYLEAGRYLEEELPALGCRFVSLADNIDTESGETEIMSFINAINDFYVRDTSERIKSVMLAKAKDGQKISGVVPFGYDRDPNARTRLIVDEYAAAVVRRVFALRVEGMGYNAIAGVLNRECIAPPRRYYFERHGRTTKAACGIAWTIRTIKLLLCNELYLGHTISMKRGTRSYRDSRVYHRDKTQWIRVENTHPPLVDKDTWEKVQQINRAAKATATNHKTLEKSLFSGLLVCLDCRARMRYSKRKDADNAYVCRTYTRSGCMECSSHRITEGTLKALVFSDISNVASEVIYDEAAIGEIIQHTLQSKREAKKAEMAQEQRRLEQELYNYDNKIELLYGERTEGHTVPKDFYANIKNIEAQRKKVENQLSVLQKAIRKIEAKKATKDKLSSLIKTNSALYEACWSHPSDVARICSLDRDLLEALVDKIEIGSRKSAEVVPTQDVRIYYKFNVAEVR
ncbi:MAG: recombinase family protein [Defluviitaleaceae bacterium]|nr:recombinase family protein [Defluviitaleaceae bacterium]